jgi:hypothetical protein
MLARGFGLDRLRLREMPIRRDARERLRIEVTRGRRQMRVDVQAPGGIPRRTAYRQVRSTGAASCAARRLS